MASTPALAFVAVVALVTVLTVGRLARDIYALARRRRPSGNRAFAVALYAIAGVGALCILWGWLVEP